MTINLFGRVYLTIESASRHYDREYQRRKMTDYHDELERCYQAVAELSRAVGVPCWLPSYWAPSKLIGNVTRELMGNRSLSTATQARLSILEREARGKGE